MVPNRGGHPGQYHGRVFLAAVDLLRSLVGARTIAASEQKIKESMPVWLETTMLPLFEGGSRTSRHSREGATTEVLDVDEGIEDDEAIPRSSPR
jgi:hypothetical protein